MKALENYRCPSLIPGWLTQNIQECWESGVRMERDCSRVGFKVDLRVSPARKPRAGSLLLELQYPGRDCVSQFPLMVSPFPSVLMHIFKNKSVLLKKLKDMPQHSRGYQRLPISVPKSKWVSELAVALWTMMVLHSGDSLTDSTGILLSLGH